jgi:DNA-directed RNA polymerase specialized sigma24 family protein
MANEGSYCPHLEKLLTRGGRGKHRRKLSIKSDKEIDRVRWDSPVRTDGCANNGVAAYIQEQCRHVSPFYLGNDFEDEQKLRSSVAAFGLNPRKVDVLALYFVKGLTFNEIAAKLGYSRAEAAATAFYDALKQLRARGIQPKKKGKA